MVNYISANPLTMSPILRNILAVIVGATACVLLNGLLLGLMMKLIATPEGFDPNDPATYHLLHAKH